MKSFIVFSDLHGDNASLLRIKSLAAESDGIIFAGDGISALKSFTEKPIFAVRGNCDLIGIEETVIEEEGVRILLTHGHRYGVKNSYISLIMRARELECSVVVFGHTHTPLCCYENGVFLLNPGASSGYKGKTYARLMLDNGRISADVFPLK